MEELQSAEPAAFRKHGHWAWYVWPTTKEGMCDPEGTAVKNLDDVAYVLECSSTRELWTSILDRKVLILEAQQDRNAFPSIDFGRIDYFCKEWAAQEYQEVLGAYPDFKRTLSSFIDAWARVTKAAA